MQYDGKLLIDLIDMCGGGNLDGLPETLLVWDSDTDTPEPKVVLAIYRGKACAENGEKYLHCAEIPGQEKLLPDLRFVEQSRNVTGIKSEHISYECDDSYKDASRGIMDWYRMFLYRDPADSSMDSRICLTDPAREHIGECRVVNIIPLNAAQLTPPMYNLILREFYGAAVAWRDNADRPMTNDMLLKWMADGNGYCAMSDDSGDMDEKARILTVADIVPDISKLNDEVDRMLRIRRYMSIEWEIPTIRVFRQSQAVADIVPDISKLNDEVDRMLRLRRYISIECEIPTIRVFRQSQAGK